MATKVKLLQTLTSVNEPIKQEDLAKLLNEPQGNFKTQLDRFKKPGWVEVNEDKEWSITDSGREELAKEIKEAGPIQSSQDMADNSPYSQFIAVGKAIGVTGTEDFFKAITDYVFTAGDYKDVAWIQEALAGMSIRADLVERWVRSWSAKTFVNKPITQDISKRLQTSKLTPEQTKKKEEEEIRDYVLDENDNPVKVGDLAGMMTYKDAVELSKIRSMGKAKAGASGNNPSNKTMPEQITEMVAAVDALRGNQTPRTNYMVRPGADGNYTVEPVEEGKPVVIPQQVAPKKEIWVVKDGVLSKMEEGQPIVLNSAPATPQPQKYIMVDKDGNQKEIAAGQPIIIVKEAAPSMLPAVSSASISVPDAEGKVHNLTLKDLELFFQVEEWKDKRRHDEESHQTRMEISGTFKDILKKASTAAERMVSAPPAEAA